MASRQTTNSGPSDSATLERACSLVNEAMFTVALQRRRVRSHEPEDNVFVMRWWADLQFFIVALRRLRRAAELANRVPSAQPTVTLALEAFDRTLPQLSKMRNVGEHIDDYALDSPNRRHRQVQRYALQVGTWNGVVYEWLGETLDVDMAHDAAHELAKAVGATSESAAAPLVNSRL